MKWAGLSSALFVVLLFVFSFLISSPVYSDVILTDEEWTELLNERQNFKTTLTAQNADFQKKLDQLEIDHQNDLTELENKYDQEIALLRIQSEVRMESLTTLKRETTWNNIKSFLAGFGFGFGTGNYTGFRLGIAFE